jgi:hypothetical protein
VTTGVESDLQRVAEAMASGEVIEDYLKSLVELRSGRLGGAPRRFSFGREWQSGGSVAPGMASAYGGEQLRKAADEANEFVDALRALSPGTSRTTIDLIARLEELRVIDLADVLADPGTTVRSTALDDAFDRLRRSLSMLGQARVRLGLELSRERSAETSTE